MRPPIREMDAPGNARKAADRATRPMFLFEKFFSLVFSSPNRTKNSSPTGLVCYQHHGHCPATIHQLLHFWRGLQGRVDLAEGWRRRCARRFSRFHPSAPYDWCQAIVCSKIGIEFTFTCPQASHFAVINRFCFEREIAVMLINAGANVNSVTLKYVSFLDNT